ncbi:MAG: type IX secretion system sortase PorU [Bacteroidales bacterium]|nr:type IX secretion system sortase PorU [Bacteroidales bacterium]
MKRLIPILCYLAVVLPLTAAIHSYADHSVLQNGTWVKIRVSESGVYRMTYEELQAAGLSNPANVRIYGYGGAMLTQNFSKAKIDDLPSVGFYMEKGTDGVFGAGDYILFYAQGSTSWEYNGTQFIHTRNPYSDYGYYFLSDNAGVQNLLTPSDAVDATGATSVDTYINYQVHELDLINLLDRESGVDGGGREFYGEAFSSSEATRTFSFTTPNTVTSEPVRLRSEVAAYSSRASRFTLSLNGESTTRRLDSVPVSDFYTKGTLTTFNQTFPATDNTHTVSLSFSNPAAGAVGNLNYIELSATCRLAMSGDAMTFRNPTNYGVATPVVYSLSNATAQTQIWNITDRAHITRVPATLSGSVLTFAGSNKDGVQEYVAVNTNGSNWLKTSVIGAVGNQDLHNLKNIDYVIICPADFVGEARRLAQAHEQKQSITWAVVTDQEVYNEFSSGTPDATAYRWLMKMLYDRGTGSNVKPSWLLLMGDGTFDNRKILSTSGQNTLLTYQAKNSTVETKAYASDDYFGFLDDNEGESDTQGRMDIGVGRLPVNTVTEAQQVVDKLVAYMANDSYGKWKNQLIFLADDGDNNLHTRVAEAGAERVRSKNPNFVANKIYLDAYPQEVDASGESYPLAKNKLDNLLKNGALYMNYSGHGGYNAITNEGMMNLQSIQKMTNQNQALWMFATCSFAHFDSGKRCAAEEAMLNPNGGAIGVISAGRTVYATQNTYINRNFCDTLFGHKDPYSYDMTVGKALAIAKNMTGTDDNKMSYVLLGDPALRLAYPTDYRIMTTTQPDTLRALDVQQMEGHIEDENAQVAEWFNGKVNITIYDKLQRVTTRDNDEKDESKKQTVTYNDYPNTLFSGSADVVNGRFSYAFMTPKDIRYNYGRGRIVYYAYDPNEGTEAVGHFENFVVGGTGSYLKQDTIGPTISLYLNTPAFTDGGTTYETPRFFADIEDENGINTVGTGIGHDLMLVVDNSATQTYVLNEFFTSADGSYQKGQVSYLMQELAEGAHTLTFRAWDLMNNSSTASLSFVVEKGADPNIYSVVTYPNPVQAAGVLNMIVNYDQPDMVLQTDICVYDMSGRLMWQHSQKNPDQVQLNLSEMGLYPGLYLYRIRIKTENSGYSSKSGKIVVVQ